VSAFQCVRFHVCAFPEHVSCVFFGEERGGGAGGAGCSLSRSSQAMHGDLPDDCRMGIRPRVGHMQRLALELVVQELYGKNGALFECFPYVCPEPVLAK
jgi:hypothetical protein